MCQIFTALCIYGEERCTSSFGDVQYNVGCFTYFVGLGGYFTTLPRAAISKDVMVMIYMAFLIDKKFSWFIFSMSHGKLKMLKSSCLLNFESNF